MRSAAPFNHVGHLMPDLRVVDRTLETQSREFSQGILESGVRSRDKDSLRVVYADAAFATKRSGRKTEKHVPLRPKRVLLRSRMRPPCFETIPCVIHRPKPVPFSPLVGKNGSKIFRWFSAETPDPLSLMSSLTPRRSGLLQCLEPNICMVILPFWRTASKAFINRFETSCRISVGYASISSVYSYRLSSTMFAASIRRV